MLLTNLADLDELVLQVRNPSTRVYVAEAVTAYRGGAYRAALVALWVAVAYDIVAKLRELAALGDANAVRKVSELDGAIAARTPEKLLRLENDLLCVGQEDFELLSRHERMELERLREDRHLCAHPAFVSEEALFTPSAEQVRAYVRAAVTHLLSQQPVQGKAALGRIQSDIAAPSFPDKQEDVDTFMRTRYLSSAKEALVRNLVVILLKAALRGDDGALPLATHRYTVLRVLRSIRAARSAIYDATLREQLPAVAAGLSEEQLLNVFPLLGDDERAWTWLDEASRIRLRSLLSGHRVTDPWDPVLDAVNVAVLKADMEAVLSSLGAAELAFVVSDHPHPALVRRALAVLEESATFRDGERNLETLILPLAPVLTADDVGAVLEVSGDSSQVWDANKAPALLLRLFDQTRQRLYPATRRSWRAFIKRMAERDEEAPYEALARALAK